jgi:DNA (cytosine-5)-methyltransferase 3A
MTYPFKVLSLFDGISAAQVAINRIGIKDYIYYASEVDKFAITVTQANYPNTIQIGDVTKVNGKDYHGVDLLVAGSPCQGFSQAGPQTNFEHPQSRLFWHFVRILEECKPKYFLLENVKMKQEWRDVISKAVGCEPREINSALVSGQSRKRLYWTNIEKKHEIEDEGILLGDILEDGIATDEMTTKQGKSFCVTSRYDSAVAWNSIQRKQRSMVLANKMRPCKPREIKKDSLCHHVADATDISGHDMLKRVYAKSGKSPTLSTMQGGNTEPKVLILPKEVKECIDKGMKNVAFTETRTEEAKQLRKEHMAKYKKDFSPRRAKVLQPRKDDKMNCITTSMTKEHTLIDNNYYYRKLSCVELERLQTFDDNYTAHVSKTQRCKALGNSFTVRIIEEILKDM